MATFRSSNSGIQFSEGYGKSSTSRTAQIRNRKIEIENTLTLYNDEKLSQLAQKCLKTTPDGRCRFELSEAEKSAHNGRENSRDTIERVEKTRKNSDAFHNSSETDQMLLSIDDLNQPKFCPPISSVQKRKVESTLDYAETLNRQAQKSYMTIATPAASEKICSLRKCITCFEMFNVTCSWYRCERCENGLNLQGKKTINQSEQDKIHSMTRKPYFPQSSFSRTRTNVQKQNAKDLQNDIEKSNGEDTESFSKQDSATNSKSRVTSDQPCHQKCELCFQLIDVASFSQCFEHALTHLQCIPSYACRTKNQDDRIFLAIETCFPYRKICLQERDRKRKADAAATDASATDVVDTDASSCEHFAETSILEALPSFGTVKTLEVLHEYTATKKAHDSTLPQDNEKPSAKRQKRDISEGFEFERSHQAVVEENLIMNSDQSRDLLKTIRANNGNIMEMPVCQSTLETMDTLELAQPRVTDTSDDPPSSEVRQASQDSDNTREISSSTVQREQEKIHSMTRKLYLPQRSFPRINDQKQNARDLQNESNGEDTENVSKQDSATNSKSRITTDQPCHQKCELCFQLIDVASSSQCIEHALTHLPSIQSYACRTKNQDNRIRFKIEKCFPYRKICLQERDRKRKAVYEATDAEATDASATDVVITDASSCKDFAETSILEALRSSGTVKTLEVLHEYKTIKKAHDSTLPRVSEKPSTKRQKLNTSEVFEFDRSHQTVMEENLIMNNDQSSDSLETNKAKNVKILELSDQQSTSETMDTFEMAQPRVTDTSAEVSQASDVSDKTKAISACVTSPFHNITAMKQDQSMHGAQPTGTAKPAEHFDDFTTFLETPSSISEDIHPTTSPMVEKHPIHVETANDHGSPKKVAQSMESSAQRTGKEDSSLQGYVDETKKHSLEPTEPAEKVDLLVRRSACDTTDVLTIATVTTFDSLMASETMETYGISEEIETIVKVNAPAPSPENRNFSEKQEEEEEVIPMNLEDFASDVEPLSSDTEAIHSTKSQNDQKFPIHDWFEYDNGSPNSISGVEEGEALQETVDETMMIDEVQGQSNEVPRAEDQISSAKNASTLSETIHAAITDAINKICQVNSPLVFGCANDYGAEMEQNLSVQREQSFVSQDVRRKDQTENTEHWEEITITLLLGPPSSRTEAIHSTAPLTVQRFSIHDDIENNHGPPDPVTESTESSIPRTEEENMAVHESMEEPMILEEVPVQSDHVPRVDDQIAVLKNDIDEESEQLEHQRAAVCIKEDGELQEDVGETENRSAERAETSFFEALATPEIVTATFPVLPTLAQITTNQDCDPIKPPKHGASSELQTVYAFQDGNMETVSEAVHLTPETRTPSKTIDALQFAKLIAQMAFSCNSQTWLEKAKKQIEQLKGKSELIELFDVSCALKAILERVHRSVVRKSEAQPGSMDVTEFLNLIRSIILFSMVELVGNELALVEEESRKFKEMEEELSIPMTTVEAALQIFLRLTCFF